MVLWSSDFTIAAIFIFVERTGCLLFGIFMMAERYCGKANVMHFRNNYTTRIPKKMQYEQRCSKKNVVRYYFHGSEWETLSVRNDTDLYKVQGILKFCIKLSIFKNSTISSKNQSFSFSPVLTYDEIFFLFRFIHT